MSHNSFVIGMQLIVWFMIGFYKIYLNVWQFRILKYVLASKLFIVFVSQID